MSVPGPSAIRIAPAAPEARVARPAPAARRLAGSGALSALIVALLTAAGVAIRLAVAHQSLFADELSTYWIVTRHGLGGVISTVHSNAEITPPLYFVLAWLTTQIGHAPELVRAPSLIAGCATIPVIYLLGLRTVGRPAALVATALTAFAPFMIYYSAEARAYGLMMFLTALSTLAMLVALDTRRVRWWIVYAACSCAAIYSHYTCVFVLGAQLVWLLWVHPEARKPAILANAGAVVAFAPWTSGVINDLTSPTSKILSALSPFTPHYVLVSLEHWSIGYPYSYLGLRHLPGAVALVLLGVAVLIAFAGLALTFTRERPLARVGRLDQRMALVFALALSVPIGEATVSAVSTHLFGVRNLAASWPAFALLLAALVVAAGPRLRFAAAALAIASFAIGAAKMLESRYQRPDFGAAASFVDRRATPGDVVIDETAELSPGPLSPLDVALRGHHRVLRALAPQERDHPFTFFDPRVTVRGAVSKAVAADGRRTFVVSYMRSTRFPARYRLVASRTFPGFLGVRVQVYANSASSRR